MEIIDYRGDCDGLTGPALEDLFRAAGLGGRVGEKILRAFRNSALVSLAYIDGRLVGACRCITDGEYHAFVYDVAVLPQYQRRGIGKELLGRLLARVNVWRVMLVADKDVQDFYREFGFAPYDGVMAKCDTRWLFDRPN